MAINYFHFFRNTNFLMQSLLYKADLHRDTIKVEVKWETNMKRHSHKPIFGTPFNGITQSQLSEVVTALDVLFIQSCKFIRSVKCPEFEIVLHCCLVLDRYTDKKSLTLLQRTAELPLISYLMHQTWNYLKSEIIVDLLERKFSDADQLFS